MDSYCHFSPHRMRKKRSHNLQCSRLSRTHCTRVVGWRELCTFDLETHLQHLRIEADVPEEVSDVAREQGQSECSVEDHLPQTFTITNRIYDLLQFVCWCRVWDGRQPEGVLQLPQDRLQKLNTTDVSEGKQPGTSL